MNLPRLPGRWQPVASTIATVGSALAALTLLIVTVAGLWNHGRDPVNLLTFVLCVVIGTGFGIALWRRGTVTREIADRASDDADRALAAAQDGPVTQPTGIAIQHWADTGDDQPRGRHAAPRPSPWPRERESA